MININRVFIATDKEFREHFDLEAMAEQALAIALDEEIFIQESERALQAVLAAAAKGTSGRTGTDESGNAFIECDGCRGIIATALPGDGAEKKALTAANVVRLVLCELGGRSFEELITDETADLKPLNELNGGQTDPVKTFNPDSDNCDAPLRNIFYINCSKSSPAAVRILLDDGIDYIHIAPGDALVLLTKDNRYISAHPRMSETLSHRVVILPKNDNDAEVIVQSHTGGQIRSRTFDRRQLTDVCADQTGGFVALCGDDILTYSSQLQPDDVDNLFIPEGERIVKILTSSRQLAALTDAGRVYTNVHSPLNNITGAVDIVIRDKFMIEAVLAKDYTPAPQNDGSNGM